MGMADRMLEVTERSLIDVVDLGRRAADELRSIDPMLTSALTGAIDEIEVRAGLHSPVRV